MIIITISGPQASGKTLIIRQFEDVFNRFKINYIIEHNKHIIVILDDDIPNKLKPMMLDEHGNRSIFDDVIEELEKVKK